MIRPPYLQAGDRVAVLSTARYISEEDMQGAYRLLRSWGLEIHLPPGLYAREHQLAGNAAHRRTLLQNALNDPQIRAIFCARGGYGTVQLLDDLRWEGFAEAPKWVVGFSDVTALHSEINRRGFMSIHGPLLSLFDRTEENALELLRQALFEGAAELKAAPHALNRRGSAQGRLCGGNLSVLYSLCGSPSALNTAGQVLFLEDLDEYLYHLDRMFFNLRRNAYFQNLAGAIIGTLTDMHDNQVPFGESAEAIAARHLGELGIPVAFAWPAGHCANNQPLVLGAEVELRVDESGARILYP